MFFPAGRSSHKSRRYLGLSPNPAIFFSFILFILAYILIITPRNVFAYSQIAEFLCEEGLRDLESGDLEAAQDEFNRA